MKSKASTAREAIRKKRRSYTGKETFKVRRAFRPATSREIVVGDDPRKEQIAKLAAEQLADKKTDQIKRYLGKPKVRLAARAKELESIDVAPAETITFGSVKALEAFRRDLYAVNGEKTSHFRSQRRGLTLTIWRDG